MLRDIADPFTLPRHHFLKYYRMTQDVVFNLIELIRDQLPQARSSAIPVHVQVLILLRFMAEGKLQKGLSQDFNHPVGQSTASRCLRRVQEAILGLHDRFIRFPAIPESRRIIQNGYNRIPGILGAVDGFLVNFKKPVENEEAFFNYRVGTAMNVQLVVDSNYNILNVRICPGSNNDRFVWQFSDAKMYMEHLRNDEEIVRTGGHYYILGDSGYTPSPSLLTPHVDAPQGTPAATYTIEHVGTRRIVEQTIGILTYTWMAIKRMRKLQYPPDAVARIIGVACVLHNFRRSRGINDGINPPIHIVRQHLERENGDFEAGMRERNHLIQQHYV